MKVKIIALSKTDGFYDDEYEFYGIEIGGVYDVFMEHENGTVVIMDGKAKPLVIHPGEFEVVK